MFVEPLVWRREKPRQPLTHHNDRTPLATIRFKVYPDFLVTSVSCDFR